MQQARILVVDDQRDVLDALRLLLKGEGYAVELVTSPAGAMEAVGSGEFDAVLTDLNFTRDTTSGAEGLELIEQLASTDPVLPVIVMTAWASIDVAVEAMRRGARDFIEKPWDNHRLASVVRNQVALRQALEQGARLKAENDLLKGIREPFIAESPVMQPVLELIERVAPSQANILITGEPGTGKGLLARVIHDLSPRKDGAFISVNMGSIPETIFESEMFGHVRGAFTDARQDRVGRFELAEGGTLFLDEIGNIPLSQQGKLLRVLESGEYERIGSSRTRRTDARIVSATNADLPSAIGSGTFRKDLLFRLNTVEISLPPLRERGEDIVPIAEVQLRELGERYQRDIGGFEPEAAEALLNHEWPGNVRELRHVIERALLMASGKRLSLADLNLGTPDHVSRPGLDAMTLEDAERVLIRGALERVGGNVNRAADALGLSRSALYRRIEKYGLQ